MNSKDFLTERSDLPEKALSMDLDHEVQMARQQCYNAAKDAIRIHSLLKSVSEMEGLEGWMQSKITKAAEYLSAVADNLEYDQIEDSVEDVVTVPSVDPDAFEDRYTSAMETASAGASASGAIATSMGGGNGFANGGPGTKKRKETA